MLDTETFCYDCVVRITYVFTMSKYTISMPNISQFIGYLCAYEWYWPDIMRKLAGYIHKVVAIFLLAASNVAEWSISKSWCYHASAMVAYQGMAYQFWMDFIRNGNALYISTVIWDDFDATAKITRWLIYLCALNNYILFYEKTGEWG